MFSELSAQSTADWFEFRPGKDNSGSRINMKHWLDTPAGRHGFVNMKGSGLYFDDGRQIKFWGVNVAGNNPFPTSNQADRWAANESPPKTQGATCLNMKKSIPLILRNIWIHIRFATWDRKI